MMNDNDLIRRGDMRNEINRLTFNPLVNELLYRILDAIPADVKPVVRGEWISVPHKRARICSHCECDEPYKFAENDADVYNFCPNCGAKMKEVNDER